MWLWPVLGALAAIGGAAATRISTAYVAGFLVVAVVVAVFLWRSQDSMVPFLLLVAAVQGGNLLQVSASGAPISTLMPILGGWALLAALLDRRPRRVARPIPHSGSMLTLSLVGFAGVVALTALAQVWRAGGRMLSLVEVMTLVQLGVFVVLTAFLLSSPRRAIWVAYVTISTGAVVAAVALADRAGILSLGTELVDSGGYTRVSGLLDDPNFFSFQLLIALAFAGHAALAAKRLVSRVLVWFAFALIFAGIASTYSAGALVGVGAILAATVLLQFRVSARRTLAAFGLIAVITAVVAVAAPPGYQETVKAKYTGITDSSFERLGTNRGAHWEAALREIESNPVLGVGLSSQNQQSAIADYYTLSTLQLSAAHNMYLGIAVGTGVFGLAGFLLVLASCFSVLWTAHSKAAREGRSETLLATACLFTALVVVATQGLQLDLQLEKFPWLLIGACLAVRRWPLAQNDEGA